VTNTILKKLSVELYLLGIQRVVGGEDYPNIPPISFFNVENRKMGAKKQSLRNERYNLNECKIILKIKIQVSKRNCKIAEK
jgi:hypothetical protein